MSIVPEVAAMPTPLVILISVPASTVSVRPLGTVTELITSTGFIAGLQTVLLVIGPPTMAALAGAEAITTRLTNNQRATTNFITTWQRAVLRANIPFESTD